MNIVHILWIDSVSEDAWIDASELKSLKHTIETIGMIAREDADTITVTHTQDLDSESYCCLIHIPKRSIIECRNLKAIDDGKRKL